MLCEALSQQARRLILTPSSAATLRTPSMARLSMLIPFLASSSHLPCVRSFGTEHLGSLLLDMGFNAAPRVLDQALDDMDPDATGEISKVANIRGAFIAQLLCSVPTIVCSLRAVDLSRMVRGECG